MIRFLSDFQVSWVRLGTAFAAIGAADFLFTVWTWIGWNSRPGFAQDPWLLYARGIRDGVSVPMGNDHPLYPFILSLWASTRPEAFTYSKLFSFALGVALVVLVYRIASERFDRRAGLAAALLVSVNWIHVALSMSLRAEVLIPPLALLCWYGVQKGFEEDGRWWLGAGACAGIAYLAKGTGQLFAYAWFGALVWTAILDGERRAVLLRRAPWFLLGFVPFAAILWWGNYALFGDPLYNFSSKHVMWLDRWADVDTVKTGELSALGYLRSHGLGGVIARLLGGIAGFVPVAFACLSPDSTFPVWRALRWPMAAAAVVCLWAGRRRLPMKEGGSWFSLFLYGGFFVLFAWYHQVSSSERFIGVLNPIVFVLLAGGVMRGWDAAAPFFGGRAPFWGKTAVAILSATVLVSLGIKTATWGWASPFKTDRPLACYRDVFDRVDGASELIYGTSGDLSYYQFRKQPKGLAIPPDPAPEDLAAWLSPRARTLVVDWEMAGKPFLSKHFERVGDRGVGLIRPVAGWRLTYTDAHHALPHVVILRRTGD